MHNDENAIINNPIAAGGTKSLHHNRNKSSPSLLGMMKDGVKRAALNDKASFANRALARDDTNTGGKVLVNAAGENKYMMQPLQKKANVLNQPAQRPQGINALKDRTNMIVQSTQLIPLKTGGDENQKPSETIATDKPLTRRKTMANFQGLSDANVEKPSLHAQNSSIPTVNTLPSTTTSTTSTSSNTSAPLPPVHRDLNTKPSKKVLKTVNEEISTIKDTSNATIEDANMISNPLTGTRSSLIESLCGGIKPMTGTGTSLIESLCGGNKKAYVASDKATLVEQLVPLPRVDMIKTAASEKPFPNILSAESNMATTNALLSELVAAQNARPNPIHTSTHISALDKHMSLNPITKPDGTTEVVEFWDETSEPENFDDEGFVTARSFKSTNTRGDGNTTGNATTVLMPKMNAKIRKELADAAKVIESMKTVEDIEDEAWDTTMVAEYGEEIFQHMKHLEVCSFSAMLTCRAVDHFSVCSHRCEREGTTSTNFSYKSLFIRHCSCQNP